jgi:hypothetical protein
MKENKSYLLFLVIGEGEEKKNVNARYAVSKSFE